MKILVTGGAGFIGSHVVDALVREGHDVLVVDNLSHSKKEYLSPQARFYEADVTQENITTIFEQERPHVIIHNAAHISVPHSIENPPHDAEQNILGSLRVFEQARRVGVQKIIFASSGGAIYGQASISPTPEDYPTKTPFSWCNSPYGIAKFTTESYLMYYQRMYNMSCVSLRFSNVYGPRQDANGEGGVVSILASKLIKKEVPTIYGTGNQTRDFVYVGDVVQAYLAALQENAKGFFNVSTGKETSINTLYAHLARILNIQSPPHHGPARAGDVDNSCLDASYIQRTLGWRPNVSLEEGLQKTVAWMQWFYKK